MTDEQSELQALQAELAVMTETAKRAMADLQNFKRRSEEERGEIQIYANLKLLEAIFPAIDNLARAFETVPEELKNNEWLKGVQAVEKGLLDELQKLGLEVINQSGIPVDANKHEVLMQIAGPANQIINVLEKGYSYKGRTIRAAKVQVGSGESS